MCVCTYVCVYIYVYKLAHMEHTEKCSLHGLWPYVKMCY